MARYSPRKFSPEVKQLSFENEIEKSMSEMRLRALVLVLIVTSIGFAQRDVQISTVRFDSGEIILTNFGNTTVDMSNWRFCSHDDNQVRVYSGGIGGSLEAGRSVLIDINTVNVAQPFDSDAYSLALFDLDAGGFGGTENIIDHLQWSIGGEDNGSAAFRSNQAVDGGLWPDPSQWIVTTENTPGIELIDVSGGILHGPGDYTTLPDVAPLLACDFDGDGQCDTTDINRIFAEAGSGASEFDLNGDQQVDGADVQVWLAEASDPNNLYLGGTQTFQAGDVNLDGGVNSIDLGLLLNNFSRMDDLNWSQGNVNTDGIVDSLDLGLLLNNFGSEPVAAASAVPEPATPLAFVLAVVLFAIGRRRR